MIDVPGHNAELVVTALDLVAIAFTTVCINIAEHQLVQIGVGVILGVTDPGDPISSHQAERSIACWLPLYFIS